MRCAGDQRGGLTVAVGDRAGHTGGPLRGAIRADCGNTRLAGEILTTDELQRLARVDPALHPWLVSLTFSAKESLFKALYPLVGQRFYFQHAELLEWTAEGRLRLGLLKDLNGDWRRGTTLEGQFGELDGQLLTLVGIAAGSSIVG